MRKGSRLKTLFALALCVCVTGLLAMLAMPTEASSDEGGYAVVYHNNPLYPELAQEPIPVPSHPTRTGGSPVRGDTLAEASAELREGIKKRQDTISVSFVADQYSKEMIDELFARAIAHTGEPTEGDYLLWHYSGWGAQISYSSWGDQYRFTVTFSMRYLSNAQQEAELDAAVESLLKRLDVGDGSAYEKVAAIYDYMCSNITYDYSGDPVAHTAYSALVKGKAVCQGYASLFYRLALTLGVDTRVISGYGNGGPHGWNIVRLKGQYYNLDATWDAVHIGSGSYRYFLRSDGNFPDHTRDEAYLTEAFYSAYPMAQSNYTHNLGAMTGDLDGNETVSEDDAIYLLQSVLLPDLFPLNQGADYDQNGEVDEDDAIYLLQHVLLPDLFPI